LCARGAARLARIIVTIAAHRCGSLDRRIQGDEVPSAFETDKCVLAHEMK